MVGYDTSVKPTGFRKNKVFRGWPYFLGGDIVLEIKAKPKVPETSISRIPKLAYSWELFKEGSDKAVYTKEDTLTPSIIDENTLRTYLKLPHRLGLGHHTLEIQVKDSVNVWATKQPIFDFELHSEDKFCWALLFIALPILGAIVWEVVRRMIGW